MIEPSSHRNPAITLSHRMTSREMAVASGVVLFWLSCAFMGGSSRVEVGLILPLRLVCVAVLAGLVLLVPRGALRRIRTPLVLLGAFAATIALQLVPLPPALWHALPGRAAFAPALTLAGADERSMPISLTPDRSWNALLALLPPLLAILGYAALREHARRRTLEGFIAVGLASALLGVLQLSGGEGSPLYWYPISHTGFPTGFFANRNHEGALLAALLPALRAWSLTRIPPVNQPLAVKLTAGAAVLFILPMILLTGSRAGLALTLVGVAGAWLVEPMSLRRSPRRRRPYVVAAGAAAVSGLLVLMLLLGRATAFQRFTQGDAVLADPRFDFLPVILSLVRSSFPVGYGFGAFDPVFRSAEPAALLRQVFVANAHDDLLELTMTGGLPALMVLGAFLYWWMTKVREITRKREGCGEVRVRRAGAVVVVIFLLASLTDYPLRSPLAASLFALACAWLGDTGAPSRTARQGGEGATGATALTVERRATALRLAATATGSLALLWIVLGVTLNVAATGAPPELAHRLWPAGSAADVALALDRLRDKDDRAELTEAGRMASNALRREPVSAAAARTLGLAQAATGDMSGADHSMAVAEGLSRRDPATQFYLIQRRVEAGDVSGALRHYDVALRTTRESYATLLPPLARSSNESTIRSRLDPILAARPIWWSAYVQQLLDSDTAPAAIADQIRALRLSPDDPNERSALQGALVKLTNARAFAEAMTILPRSARAGTVRDGGFEKPDIFQPFDWRLSDDPHLSATREPGPQGHPGQVLRLIADQERGGEVARQLVALAPGEHRLTVVVGNSGAGAGEAPRIEIGCAGDKAVVAIIPLIGQPSPLGRVEKSFRVPAGCGFQWLVITTPAARNVNTWIDDLAIR